MHFILFRFNSITEVVVVHYLYLLGGHSKFWPRTTIIEEAKIIQGCPFFYEIFTVNHNKDFRLNCFETTSPNGLVDLSRNHMAEMV